MDPIRLKEGAIITDKIELDERPQSSPEQDIFAPAVSTSAEEAGTQSLNYADTFGVFSRRGDAIQSPEGAQGIFHRGLRFIGRFELALGGQRPVLLSSSIRDENQYLSVDMTNATLTTPSGEIPHGTLHIKRKTVMGDGFCECELRVVNYGQRAGRFSMAFYFNADFKDLFEIRGVARSRHGDLAEPVIENDSCLFSYEGLDGISRASCIGFSPKPSQLESGFCNYDLKLQPGEEKVLTYTLSFFEGVGRAEIIHQQGSQRQNTVGKESYFQFPKVESSNQVFNTWWRRSEVDMQALTARTEDGLYPYAGVPWYNTPFGRDGLITALETLSFEPSLAKGVLAFLASRQAGKDDASRDAEPGKIIHEIRQGEMAETGELPFKTYYGTVDATPLFLMLLGEYYLRTDDKEFVQKLLPNAVRALEWIDKYGDLDEDGFTEYRRRSPQGLLNQGWKDSHDALSHSDGSPAVGAIALAEVQGYVYRAKKLMSRVVTDFGDQEWASRLDSEAEVLKRNFNKSFWSAEKGIFAMALDGENRPCLVKNSNIGHCLYTGIVDKEKAKAVVDVLMSEEMFTGWGIRTLGQGESRYNPMSYHNGSVWPHDTALVAAGMARYGFQKEFNQIFDGIFEATSHFHVHRLPELFCGFKRRTGEGPTGYPVACMPQAWAVGCSFFLTHWALRVEVDAPRKTLSFNAPLLPASLQWLKIRGLRVAEGAFDIKFLQHHTDVGVNILKKPEGWSVFVSK